MGEVKDWKRRECRVDRSRLLILGHACANGPTPEISTLFCPACNRSYLYLGSDPAAYGVLEWTSDGDDYIPAADSSAAQSALGPDAWALHTSNLFSRVEHFLENRSNPDPTLHCYMDGSAVPVIAEFPVEGRFSAKFTWCRRCETGFCETWDPVYGWDTVASFILGRNPRRYVLKNLIDEHTDALVVDDYLSQIPPPAPPTKAGTRSDSAPGSP